MLFETPDWEDRDGSRSLGLVAARRRGDQIHGLMVARFESRLPIGEHKGGRFGNGCLLAKGDRCRVQPAQGPCGGGASGQSQGVGGLGRRAFDVAGVDVGGGQGRSPKGLVNAPLIRLLAQELLEEIGCGCRLAEE